MGAGHSHNHAHDHGHSHAPADFGRAFAIGVLLNSAFVLVEAGFGQRRKMLRRSLAGLVDDAAFRSGGVRPEARAEELTVEDWGRLAEAVGDAGP